MPELPEVETIARQLNSVLKGKKITLIEKRRVSSFIGGEKEFSGAEIERVDRHAKVMVIHFRQLEVVLMIHLKMTGQLIFEASEGSEERVVGGHPSEDFVRAMPSVHTRVIFHFTDGSKLYFNDMRAFGWVRAVERVELKRLEASWPPDVTEERFTREYLGNLVKRSKKAIKLLLMDQEKIGGVGNIYANDALNLARVAPMRLSNSLSEEEVAAVYGATKKVIDLGIKYGGASYSDYKDTQGRGGKYQEHFLVYAKEGEKCPNCGGKIKKTKLGGRGTYYCESCQK